MNIEKLTFFMHAGYSISDTKEWRGLNSKAKPKIFCPFYCVNIFFPTWTYPFCQVIPSLYSWKSKEDYLSTFRMKMFVLLLVGNYFSTERMSIYAKIVKSVWQYYDEAFTIFLAWSKEIMQKGRRGFRPEWMLQKFCTKEAFSFEKSIGIGWTRVKFTQSSPRYIDQK